MNQKLGTKKKDQFDDDEDDEDLSDEQEDDEQNYGGKKDSAVQSKVGIKLQVMNSPAAICVPLISIVV